MIHRTLHGTVSLRKSRGKNRVRVYPKTRQVLTKLIAHDVYLPYGRDLTLWRKSDTEARALFSRIATALNQLGPLN